MILSVYEKVFINGSELQRKKILRTWETKRSETEDCHAKGKEAYWEDPEKGQEIFDHVPARHRVLFYIRLSAHAGHLGRVCRV